MNTPPPAGGPTQRDGLSPLAKWGGGFILLFIVIVVVAEAVAHPSAKSSASSGGGGADIGLVAAESFCSPSGIDDVYTGDGHVTFYLTFENTGGSDGTISATPVRHYSDGEVNESAMDQVEVDVGAGETLKTRTTAMKYKAHEHEITDCGVLAGGDEISIAVD